MEWLIFTLYAAMGVTLIIKYARTRDAVFMWLRSFSILSLLRSSDTKPAY